MLVSISLRMYRESVALSIHRNRPALDVRIAPPEATEGELAGFRPHLLMHNDTTSVPTEALEGVPYRVEILYSDGMDARVHGIDADGGISEVRDISTDDLLRVVDTMAALSARGVADQETREAGQG